MIRKGVNIISIAAVLLSATVATASSGGYSYSGINICDLDPRQHCPETHVCSASSIYYGCPMRRAGKSVQFHLPYEMVWREAPTLVSLPEGQYLANVHDVWCQPGILGRLETQITAVSRFRDEAPWFPIAQTEVLIPENLGATKVQGSVRVQRLRETREVCNFGFYIPWLPDTVRPTWELYEQLCQKAEPFDKLVVTNVWTGPPGARVAPRYTYEAYRASAHHRHRVRLVIWQLNGDGNWSVAGQKEFTINHEENAAGPGGGVLLSGRPRIDEWQSLGMDTVVPEGTPVKLTVELQRTVPEGPGGPQNWSIKVLRSPEILAENCIPNYLDNTCL